MRRANRMTAAAALVAAISLAFACGGSGGSTSPTPTPTPHPTATPYDDFTSGMRASKWNSGLRQAAVSSGAAVLSHGITGVAASTSYTTVADAVTAGEVTTWQADVTVTSAAVTGDSLTRAGIDLLFQPAADRITGSDDQAHALYARVVLVKSSGSFVALRQLFECTAVDCSTSASVGTASGSWAGAGLAVALDTTYTLSISLNATTKVVTYRISGGAYPSGVTETIDGSTGTPPFAVDLSAANQYRARLLVQVRGGAAGGGDGSVAAEFDNVVAGIDGGAAAAFDDFSSGTLDPSRWEVGGEAVEAAAGGGLRLALTQRDTPAKVATSLVDPGVAAGLQAGVTVTQDAHAGAGRVAARLAGTLYNDGTNGSGTAPDVREAGSEVGDVLALVSMTDTDVSYAVLRCDTALCSSGSGGYTFVQQPTSIGTVTLGSKHTLAWWWDAASHAVSFQLDGGTPVVFDPTTAGAGFPVAGPANVPFRHLAVAAGNASATDQFTSGSTGSIAAIFTDVATF